MGPSPAIALSVRRANAYAAWLRTPRFVRNALISLPTFLLDLGLLFLAVRFGRLNYIIATIASFLIANAIGYFLARWLVFNGTTRELRAGLVYFLSIAALSAFALTPLMWVSVEFLHLGVIVSRLLAAIVVGAGGYLLNAVFNFRVEPPPPA